MPFSAVVSACLDFRVLVWVFVRPRSYLQASPERRPQTTTSIKLSLFHIALSAVMAMATYHHERGTVGGLDSLRSRRGLSFSPVWYWVLRYIALGCDVGLLRSRQVKAMVGDVQKSGAAHPSASCLSDCKDASEQPKRLPCMHEQRDRNDESQTGTAAVAGTAPESRAWSSSKQVEELRQGGAS